MGAPDTTTIDFVTIGGFLGAGKTTTILRLARHHMEQGQRVGIIANDLGRGLADTQTYLAAGLAVEEMAGQCFACTFDELIAAAGRLQDGHHPDVLLAEPAGSCTDIVSRVIEPLKTVYADRFQVAPYVTLLDPDRATKALSGTGPAGLSAKVTYLYKMQQNEADIVAINKCDTLNPERRAELQKLIAHNFPKAEVLFISARTGEGFDDLTAMLEGGAPAGLNPLGDSAHPGFNRQASAEADTQLAWLNQSWIVSRGSGFHPDTWLLELAWEVQNQLLTIEAEPVHVKLMLVHENNMALANFVSGDQLPELSQPARGPMTHARLIINGRVEAPPQSLRHATEQAVRISAEAAGIETTCETSEVLAPSLDPATCERSPGSATAENSLTTKPTKKR